MKARCTILVALVACSLTACVGRAVVPFVDAPATPEELALRRVARAAERAESAMLAVNELNLVARYNPAPCDCPAWEVAVAGGWERVALRPAREAEPGLDQVLAGAEIAESARLRVEVVRTLETVAGPNGRPYAVLDVVRIVAGAEEP